MIGSYRRTAKVSKWLTLQLTLWKYTNGIS
jgi:hypothetical protein